MVAKHDRVALAKIAQHFYEAVNKKQEDDLDLRAKFTEVVKKNKPLLGVRMISVYGHLMDESMIAGADLHNKTRTQAQIDEDLAPATIFLGELYANMVDGVLSADEQRALLPEGARTQENRDGFMAMRATYLARLCEKPRIG